MIHHGPTHPGARNRLSWLAGAAWLALGVLTAWYVAQQWGAAEVALSALPGGKWAVPVAMTFVGVLVALWPRRIVLTASIVVAALLFVRSATWAADPALTHELTQHVVSAALVAIAGGAALLAWRHPAGRTETPRGPDTAADEVASPRSG